MNTEQANRACQHSPPADGVPVPVLMYHSVSDAPAASTRALSVRPAEFGAQLCYLRRQGFTGLTFGELGQRRRTGQPFPARPIVLTFDDGYADLIEEALPIMIEHGFPATVFVTTGWLRDAGQLRGRDGTRPHAVMGTARGAVGRWRRGRRAQSQSSPAGPDLRSTIADRARRLQAIVGRSPRPPCLQPRLPVRVLQQARTNCCARNRLPTGGRRRKRNGRINLRPFPRAPPHHPTVNLIGHIRVDCEWKADTTSLRSRSRAHRRMGLCPAYAIRTANSAEGARTPRHRSRRCPMIPTRARPLRVAMVYRERPAPDGWY